MTKKYQKQKDWMLKNYREKQEKQTIIYRNEPTKGKKNEAEKRPPYKINLGKYISEQIEWVKYFCLNGTQFQTKDEAKEFNYFYFVSVTFNNHQLKREISTNHAQSEIDKLYNKILQILIHKSKYNKHKSKQPFMVMWPDTGQGSGLHYHGLISLNLEQHGKIMEMDIEERFAEYDRLNHPLSELKFTQPQIFPKGFETLLNDYWKKHSFNRDIKIMRFDDRASVISNVEHLIRYSNKNTGRLAQEKRDFFVYPKSSSEFQCQYCPPFKNPSS